MHRCLNLSKLQFPWNLYRWNACSLVCLHSACSQFHTVLCITSIEDTWDEWAQWCGIFFFFSWSKWAQWDSPIFICYAAAVVKFHRPADKFCPRSHSWGFNWLSLYSDHDGWWLLNLYDADLPAPADAQSASPLSTPVVSKYIIDLKEKKKELKSR